MKNVVVAGIGIGLLAGVAWLVNRDSLPAQANQKSEAKPFAHIPDTISKEAQDLLRSLPDPALRPAYPAPDDVAGWKRLWEDREAQNKPLVEAALKRYEPTVVERKLGG